VNKISKSKSNGKVYPKNNMMMMRYVGMDLHKNYLQIAVVDEKGKLIENSKIENDIQKIGKFFDHINGVKIKKQNTHTKVVMESSCVWYYIYEYLTEEKNLNVKLSNPIKTRAIASAKIKTDKLDAIKLANLLRGGYISECYVPDKRIIELRELVRHRSALVRMRTKLKNKIHGILLMKGIKIINHHPFSIGYIEQLKKLNNYRIDTYIRLFSSIDNEIRTISKNIISFTRQNATTKLLMTIPGIGYYSALLVMSEIGDISRFPDSNHLCSYAGLVPSTHSSGGITHHGPITKTGSKYLRWIMIECTRSHVRYNKKSNVTTFYNKLLKNKGSSSKAIIAASSKLLKIIYWIMKEKREYTNKINNQN